MVVGIQSPSAPLSEKPNPVFLARNQHSGKPVVWYLRDPLLSPCPSLSCDTEAVDRAGRGLSQDSACGSLPLPVRAHTPLFSGETCTEPLPLRGREPPGRDSPQLMTG